jgi:hypothetical protein
MSGLERGFHGRRTVRAQLGLGKPLTHSKSGMAGVRATLKVILRRLREAPVLTHGEHVTKSAHAGMARVALKGLSAMSTP